MEGSTVQGSPFRVTVCKRLTAGTFQPLNSEPRTLNLRTLTPETYNIVLMANSLCQPAPLIKSTVFEEA